MYEVVMPQLSDSMDEGKLVSWKVKVGERVKSGDVIAEVESDKAIMEVQSFQEGTVSELLVKEDQSVKVGTVIAKIATDTKDTKDTKEAPPIQQKKVEPKEHNNVVEDIFHIDEKVSKEKKVTKQSSIKKSKGASPKARAKAALYGVDTAMVMQHLGQTTLHSADLDRYMQERYFTPKALKLLKAYHIDMNSFDLDHKIDEQELESYIKSHELALPKPLTPMQKAIINNVNASTQKPVFHIYESVNASYLLEHKQKSITVWLLFIVSKVMMLHEAFRSKLMEDALVVMPNASISLAVADEKDLYMPVITDVNTLSIDEIEEKLQTFKIKLQKRNFTQDDMRGSTFGISNLGMLGVERFDAMINSDDAAILAVGAVVDGKISLTLTVDHRIINGYEAALFMADLKRELQNSLNFKGV